MKLTTFMMINREGRFYDTTLVCEYKPGRPAPFSRNPDSNTFSDTGESSEFELEECFASEVFDADGTALESEVGKKIELTDSEYEDLHDKLDEIYSDKLYRGEL